MSNVIGTIPVRSDAYYATTSTSTVLRYRMRVLSRTAALDTVLVQYRPKVRVRVRAQDRRRVDDDTARRMNTITRHHPCGLATLEAVYEFTTLSDDCCLLPTAYCLLDAYCPLPTVVMPTVQHCLLPIYRLQVPVLPSAYSTTVLPIYYLLPAYLLSTAYCILPTVLPTVLPLLPLLPILSILPTAYCLLPTADCRLRTAYYCLLLPTAYCLLPPAVLPPASARAPHASCTVLPATAYCLLPTA